MAKTAFLVSFCPMTRVVIDVADPNNLTDDEQDALVAQAREQILQYADEKLNGENIDEVRTDAECPYGTLKNEKNSILITAEIEIGNGLGYNGMTLFNVPVPADITEEDFRHELTSLMDVEWQNDGDFRYIAITDKEQNETRSCHLLATLEEN